MSHCICGIPSSMPWPKCDHCGERAACIGRYEGCEENGYACDVCCGHGNEDGWCEPLHEVDPE